MNKNLLTVLTLLIILGAAFASFAGLWPSNETGEPVFFTNIYGEHIELDGRGLYRNDSRSYAAQARAQDAVTLLAAIPLLLWGLSGFRRGSVRGQLILCGSLAYFLYTYSSYSYLSYFNPLFLLYTVIYGMSLFAFVLLFSSISPESVRNCLKPGYPRRFLGIYLIILAVLIYLMWLNRIIPALGGRTGPAEIDHYSTLIIQANDMAVILPAAFISGILILKDSPFGVKLGIVLYMKFLTMALALFAMMIVMVYSGVEISNMESVLFAVILLIGIATSLILLLSLKTDKKE